MGQCSLSVTGAPLMLYTLTHCHLCSCFAQVHLFIQTLCEHLVLDCVVELHPASFFLDRKRFLPKVFFANSSFLMSRFDLTRRVTRHLSPKQTEFVFCYSFDKVSHLSILKV